MLTLYKPKTILSFGKYEGERLKDIIKRDPQYITWCLANISGFGISRKAKIKLERNLKRKTTACEYDSNWSNWSYQNFRYYDEVDPDYDDQFLWEDPLNY